MPVATPAQTRLATAAAKARSRKVEFEESKIGSLYSTRVTRRVVFMILLMLFIVPLLTPSPASQAEQDGLENLFLLGSFNTTTPDVFRTVRTLHS